MAQCVVHAQVVSASSSLALSYPTPVTMAPYLLTRYCVGVWTHLDCVWMPRVTPQQAAAALGISVEAVRPRVHAGILEPSGVPRSWSFDLVRAESYLG